ncbi:hypothetical protein BDDG_12673 [Blastomyces dermatitidis ATCC 18188]|uniref:Uncharacterized protein n=1 Tax=Ajellomyces dermatitidis (strain ATCC 18188 / CBS 674.68) TaxID=653446 RepID=A0A0J9EST0_AJEDA|nr:hypothetical protein BDDG_12673 [Blastomyces dermatitidis ATCC 18188]
MASLGDPDLGHICGEFESLIDSPGMMSLAEEWISSGGEERKWDAFFRNTQSGDLTSLWGFQAICRQFPS